MSLDEELTAFTEDRKEHIAKVIEPNLREGRIVILDRYFYSTIAYQGARGRDVAELNGSMRAFAPVPDVVFLMDVDPNVGLSRISNGRRETPNEFEKPEYLADVRNIFNRLHEADNEIRLIDGHQSISAVQAEVASVLLAGALKARCAKPWPCEDLFCTYRKFGNCRWAELRKSLSVNSSEVCDREGCDEAATLYAHIEKRWLCRTHFGLEKATDTN